MRGFELTAAVAAILCMAAVGVTVFSLPRPALDADGRPSRTVPGYWCHSTRDLAPRMDALARELVVCGIDGDVVRVGVLPEPGMASSLPGSEAWGAAYALSEVRHVERDGWHYFVDPSRIGLPIGPEHTANDTRRHRPHRDARRHDPGQRVEDRRRRTRRRVEVRRGELTTDALLDSLGQAHLAPGADGYVLSRIRPGSLPFRIGLREGDRVTHVQGVHLGGLDAAGRAWERIQRADRRTRGDGTDLDIRLVRDGIAMNLDIHLM